MDECKCLHTSTGEGGGVRQHMVHFKHVIKYLMLIGAETPKFDLRYFLSAL